MASTPLVPAANGIDLTTSFQDLYDVPLGKSRAGIDAATFNNYSSNNITVTVRLVQSGAGDIFDEIITEETIRAKKNFLAPAMIGQALLSGGKIQAKVSANNSVNANITVTEIDT
ncbi:MAG: hypothetical protein V3U02_11440 [Calditrichia bacterium]